MGQELFKPNPVRTTSKEIFEMETMHKLTKDVSAQNLGLVSYVDLINYMNGHSFEPAIITRNSMFSMGLCLPSIAFIDPHKTRESIYYLYSIHNNTAKPYLVDPSHAMESEHMALLQLGISVALYRLVSGRSDLDKSLRKYGEAILKLFNKNAFYQNTFGIDTVIGKFEVMPTLLGLLVLEIHDLVFGTDLSSIKNNVLSFVEEKLIDPETGLFYSYYNTGFMEYPGERTIQDITWNSTGLKASTNGLGIVFMNYFRPDLAQKAWISFKEMFLDCLMRVSACEIAESAGKSFVTQLGPGSEDLFSALFASKEMRDIDTFDKLQSYIYQIGNPIFREGHVKYTEFGEYSELMSYFIHLSRVHVGWKNIMEHDWEIYYDWDFIVEV